MKLSKRLEILTSIMLNRNLSDAERRLCWFLLLIKTNEQTSLCYCSNQHIAKELGLDLRTIHRAKQHLKKIRVLHWTQSTSGVHATPVCSYRFIEGLGGVHATRQNENIPLRASTPLAASTPLVASTPVAHTPPDQTKNGYYAKFGSPELDYWDAFLRKTTGKTAPRDRRGGWHFPSQWPKESVQ